MKSDATVIDKKQIQLKKSICCRKNQHHNEGDCNTMVFVLQKIPISLTKTVLEKTSNPTFNMKEVDLDVVIEQVNYKNQYFLLIFPYFQTEILLAHFESRFGRSKRDVVLENERKIHKGGYVKEFFFVNLQVGILQLYYELTSSQIILKDVK